MGLKVEFDGLDYQVINYQVDEASTPLGAGDTSGSVGSLSFEIPAIDPDIHPGHDLVRFGPQILLNKPVYLSDSTRGFTVGTVVSTSRNDLSGNYSIRCISRLGKLNTYNVQAQPYSGTLRGAFIYYLSLAGITTDYLIDGDIDNRPVVMPGWEGELWLKLKQLAAAQDCDLTLVSGIIVLRPIRQNVVARGRDLTRDGSGGSDSLARAIEVYKYTNTPITNKLVYPAGGWSPEVPTINVNSGQTVVETLELSASVSSIQQPVMNTFVPASHDSSSVFTVVGDDGFPIPPAAWTANGGSLRVDINPDTTSLSVTITAPTGLFNKDNTEIGVYGIALSDDFNTGRYSTLRIVGTGVAFEKELLRIPTGVPASRTNTDVGVTIDNPFLTSYEQAYRTGGRTASKYTGRDLSISGTVLSVSNIGESGDVTYPTYVDVQTRFNGLTYAQVQDLLAGRTYAEFQAELYAEVRDKFENQVFGNVSGARIYDRRSRRWYRIRTASVSPSVISFDAEDDLTYADAQGVYEGLTYAQLQVLYTDRSYADMEMMGLYNGS